MQLLNFDAESLLLLLILWESLWTQFSIFTFKASTEEEVKWLQPIIASAQARFACTSSCLVFSEPDLRFLSCSSLVSLESESSETPADCEVH